MTLQEQIRKDMIQAMKDKNIEVRDILRIAVGDFARLNKEFGKELSDKVIIKKIIRPMIANDNEHGNGSEAKILEQYLPIMFSEEKVTDIVTGIINDNGYTTMKNMRDVMNEIEELPTSLQINNKIASKLAKQLLGQ